MKLHNIASLNNLLLGAIIVINAYVILTPIIPSLAFAIGSHSGQRQALTNKIQHSLTETDGATNNASVTNQPNSLIVPSMLLDQPILEGRDTYAVLNKGILRVQTSSTPDKGGNTVLIGHRFTYSIPKGVFYHLDKLAVGDEIGITWNNKPYRYQVATVKVVPPTETSVQDATDNAQLTLYTCTTLLWPKDRLVVIARLVEPAIL